jgi:hypothetical protein
VRDGLPSCSKIKIYSDSVSSVPPVQRNSNVRELVQLTLDWNQVYDLNRLIRTGGDGQAWYFLAGTIDATYSSASTKYTMVLNGKSTLSLISIESANEILIGKRYDAVTAELA